MQLDRSLLETESKKYNYVSFSTLFSQKQSQMLMDFSVKGSDKSTPLDKSKKDTKCGTFYW